MLEPVFSEEDEIPKERPAKVTKKDYNNELGKSIKDGNRERFEELLHELKENKETNYDLKKSSYIKRTLLQYACQNGAAFAVSALIEAGVDPNQTSEFTSMPPLIEAASLGNIEILKLLTEREQVKLNAFDNAQLTALHKVTQKLIYSKSAEERLRYLECLDLLLKYAPRDRVSKKTGRFIDINAQDCSGNTPLHFAALSGVEKAVLELLRHGAHLGIRNKQNETPIKRINASTLERHMDESCIFIQEDPYKGFSIKFNYSVLAPPRQKASGGSNKSGNSEPSEEQIECTQFCISPENRINDDGNVDPEEKVNPEYEALWHMSTSKQHQFLLKHPLVTSFLRLKWENISTFYYFNLGIYTFSVFILTAYILLLHSGWAVPNWLICTLWYFSLICVLVLYAREVFQLGIAPCCYVFNLENYTELAMLITTTLVLMNWHDAASWRHLSAVAILLVWVEELLLLGRLPRLAIFVTTFKTVFIRFLLLLCWYSTLFVGFGLSFFLVFGGDIPDTNATECEKESDFAEVQDSLLKVLPMMIGEFDFGDLPFDSNPTTSRIIFVAFLFLISIVLLNLLNGLAVSDTQEVLSKAEILSYVSQVELMSYIESILLGDPFEFLANWPAPISSIHRKCFIYSSPILGLFRWAFINGFIPARRAMLFHDCLPEKCLIVFSSSNQIFLDTNQRPKCRCHDKFHLDEDIIDSAIQRTRVSEKALGPTFKDILNKMDELQKSILLLLKEQRT